MPQIGGFLWPLQRVPAIALLSQFHWFFILQPGSHFAIADRTFSLFFLEGTGNQAPGARPFHEKTWIGKSNLKL